MSVVRLSPCRTGPFVGLGSGLDPPGYWSFLPGRRSVGSVAHPAEHAGGVRRAVVKIYHGRNIDHLCDMWRRAQEEADKRIPEWA
jgi:hypothetical protein